MKTLLSILCLLAFCISAQPQHTDSQFGRCFSTYNIYDEYLWTYPSFEYERPEETLAMWVENSGIAHVTFRVGNNGVRGCEGFMVTDIRLVAMDGKLICASDVENGCNGF